MTRSGLRSTSPLSAWVEPWLPQIKTMLRKGAKIAVTSRDYIYNRARKDIKEGAFPLPAESQVVIDVRDLTANEKRQRIYDHIKLGRARIRKSFWNSGKAAPRKGCRSSALPLQNHSKAAGGSYLYRQPQHTQPWS